MRPRLYPPQKPWELEPHFGAHMLAMTAEGLHDKSAIAEQLAWRDQRIAELEADNERLEQAMFEGHDQATFDANSRRIQAEVSDMRMARMLLDVLSAQPCECKGTGATVGASGFQLCAKCAAERTAKDAVTARLKNLDALAAEAAELNFERVAIQRNLALAALGLPLNATPEQIRERGAGLRQSESVALAASQWRQLDESEPIGSDVPNEALKRLAFLVDETPKR